MIIHISYFFNNSQGESSLHDLIIEGLPKITEILITDGLYSATFLPIL